MLSAAEQPESKPALAVNLAREESDLTPIDAKVIPKWLGVDHANVALDLPMLRQQIDEQRFGRTYGEHLLWLAFILAAIEFTYANSLMRKSGPPKVSIDAAGHVSTHARDASTP